MRRRINQGDYISADHGIQDQLSKRIDDEKNHLVGNKLVYLSQADHRTPSPESYQKERANIRPATCGHQLPLDLRPAFREPL